MTCSCLACALQFLIFSQYRHNNLRKQLILFILPIGEYPCYSCPTCNCNRCKRDERFNSKPTEPSSLCNVVSFCVDASVVMVAINVKEKRIATAASIIAISLKFIISCSSLGCFSSLPEWGTALLMH